jgi:phage terminase small subunit
MNEIPLPKEPRHQRFADLRLAGKSLIEAFQGAGFSTKDRRSSSNAKRIEKRPDVQAYIEAVRQRAATGSVMSVEEKRQFLARIVRVPLILIDPTNPGDPNADLIKKTKRKVIEGNEQNPEAWVYDELEKYDALRAIDEDNKLAGEDPASKAISELASALSSLGGPALPDDRM